MAGDPVFLHDIYLAWCDEQPVPVIDDFGMNLMKIETAPWHLYGMNDAICLLKGRDGFVSIFCFDQPADHHKIWLEAIDKNGVESDKGEIFDEVKIRAAK